MKRDPRIRPGLRVARCFPRLHCPRQSKCARGAATLPLVGASVTDHSATNAWDAETCAGIAGDQVPAKPEATKPAPRVFKSICG